MIQSNQILHRDQNMWKLLQGLPYAPAHRCGVHGAVFLWLSCVWSYYGECWRAFSLRS